MSVFVDTNVFVYARDTAVPEKHRRAGAWIEHLWVSGDGRTGFQVLQEYYVTVTRKLRPGLSKEQARADVSDLLTWHPTVIDDQVLHAAWAAEHRFGLSFWDSLIVGAAHVADCDVLLTEDLQDGADLDGIRVQSPFSADPL